MTTETTIPKPCGAPQTPDCPNPPTHYVGFLSTTTGLIADGVFHPGTTYRRVCISCLAGLPQLVSSEPLKGTELAAMRDALLSAGYQDIAEHGRLRVGARIRHRGHQWSEAFANGTGFVAALTEKPDSAWSRTYRMPDIELVAIWDKPRPFDDSSRLSRLAQYHVDVIEPAEVTQ